MRLRVNLILKREARLTSKDYRQIFLRVLKKAFELGYAIDLAYLGDMNRKAWRPFTFSIFLGRGGGVAGEATVLGVNPHILFSTGDPVLFGKTLKGFQLLSKDFGLVSNLLNSDVELERIFVEPLVPRSKWESEICFKTCGLMILSYTNAKGELKYLSRDLEDKGLFEETLNQRLEERINFLRDTGFSVPNYSYVKVISLNLKPTMIYRAKGAEHWYLPGYRGKLWLSSTPDMMKFMYDYGVGVKTGQGFGMLEICKDGGMR